MGAEPTFRQPAGVRPSRGVASPRTPATGVHPRGEIHPTGAGPPAPAPRPDTVDLRGRRPAHAAGPRAEPAPFPDTVDPRVRLHPYYGEARTRLVQPDHVRVQSAYFWKHWVPLLGPDLAVLVVQLRNMCYYNPATGERRDWCFPAQATLAAAIGVKNTHTIANLLKRPYADLFVRVEERYRYDPALGKKVQTSSIYYVRMDDPLTPADAVALAQELASAGPAVPSAPAAPQRMAAGSPAAPAAPGGTPEGNRSPQPAVAHGRREATAGAPGDLGGCPASAPAALPTVGTTRTHDTHESLLTRKYRVRSQHACAGDGPDAKFSRQQARENFASASARNFRDEEVLRRESAEEQRA